MWCAIRCAGWTENAPEGVGVHVTGGWGWRQLPAWPPPAAQRCPHLRPRARLGAEPAPAGPAVARFVFDPADPTPTVGEAAVVRPARLPRRLALGRPRRRRHLHRPGARRPAGGDRRTPNRSWRTAPIPAGPMWVRISEASTPTGGPATSATVTSAGCRAMQQLLRLDLDPIAHRFAAGARHPGVDRRGGSTRGSPAIPAPANRCGRRRDCCAPPTPSARLRGSSCPPSSPWVA